MSLSEAISEAGQSYAEQLSDAPVGVRANLTPAAIEVVSNLAEDTVIAGAMDVAVGVNKVAMFANPFVGGAEEMLYVDEQAALRWARHLNAGEVAAESGDDTSGWSVERLLGDVVEVVVAVHPTGAVFAWVLHGDATSRHLTSFELVADPSVRDGYRWAAGEVWLPDMNLSGLSVQYCADRPATPVVFVTDPGEPRLFWYLPNFSADAEGSWWHPGGDFAYDPADRGAVVVAGVDDPSEVDQPNSVVQVVRVWSAAEDGLWVTTYLPRVPDQPYTRQRVLAGQGVGLAGRWVHPDGAGVIARATTGRLVFAVAPAPGGWLSPTFVLDQPLEDLRVWQDADNLLHLYARDAEASLVAVHQTGWVQDPQAPMRLGLPVWDSHPDPSGESVLTTRPLVAQMATYAVDAFPDELPSQHVMHQGVEPGEACAIYTQSTRTNFWSTEKVRLVPEKLPAAYSVPRYQTVLSVKDGFGAPMAGVAVSLTADVPVDLEVGGRFYRTGSITPTTLVTDPMGRVTMRVVANGLSVPMLYATAPGLAQSVTVQMAADVHKFLAGDATLPNHGEGFTAATVTSAKKADGKPLFPTLRESHVAGTWPPSAQDVVTWCQGAFAVDAGQPMPAAMRTGLGAGEQVRGFTLQTHDPDRAGFEVYTSPEQLTARREAITAKGGIFDEAEDWWGDVWQGIREGVNDVAEVFVDLVDSVIEIAVKLADGVMAVLRAAWDDIMTAAHAVEAVFVAVGAAIEDAIAWLKWAFDFKDVIAFAQHLDGQLRQLPAMVRPVLDYYEPKLHGFFLAQEETVHQVFTDLKQQVLPNRTAGSLQTPMAGVPAEANDPAGARAADQVQGPHASWLTDKLTNTGGTGSAGALGLDEDLKARLDGLAEEFLLILTTSKAGPRLEAVIDDIGKLFTNLFNAEDPQTAIAMELATLFDILEQLVEAGLEFLDSITHQVIEWLRTALDTFIELLDTPVTGIPLIEVLWDYLIAAADINPADFPLTWGNLCAVFAAFPTTVICKMITGQPPITDRAAGSVVGPVNEIFLGIADLLEIGSNLMLDSPFFATSRATGFRVLMGVRLYRMLFEFPTLYGFEFPPTRRAAAAAWTAWGIDVVFNVANNIVFLATDNPLERYAGGSTLARVAASAACTTYGTGTAVLAGLTWWPVADYNGYVVARLIGLVNRRNPLALNFVPTIAALNPTPLTQLAGGVKRVSDVVSLGFCGLSRIVFAADHLRSPLSIGSSGQLKGAAVGQAYDSGPIGLHGGIPTYFWRALDELPAGLELVSTPSSDSGKTAHLVGTPRTDGDYEFRLQVKDSYIIDPSEATQSFRLTVVGKPEASFTKSKDQGVAPLEVEFHDTSIGGATSWAWDLGDGQKSTQQNPVILYKQPGTYQVTLTATNLAGSDTSPPQTVVVEPGDVG